MSRDLVTPNDLIGQLLGGDAGGWSAIMDAQGDHSGRVESGEYDRAAELAASLFASGPGEELMQFLINETLLKATWPGDLMGRDQLTTYGPWREGQNSIVVLLHALAARGRRLAEENPDG